MKYRSRTEIITTMLESARDGVTKTKIMYKSYLSYTQLIEYMKILQENDLLTYEAGKQIYRVSAKGYKYLSASNEINDLITSKSKSYHQQVLKRQVQNNLQF